MKCEFCGGNLDLEAEVCPHCGQLNRQAKQHVEDMKRYQGAFADTQKDVYTTVRRYSDITVRAILIAVLVIVLMIIMAVNANSYRIWRGAVKAQNRLQKNTVVAAMDKYLENEDFLGFADYCYDKEIDGYEDGFEEYYYICSTAKSYQSLYTELVRRAFPMESYGDSYEWLGDSLDYFYQSVQRADAEYTYLAADMALTERYLGEMEEQVQALLITYCDLTEEEAAGLREMSKSERSLLIERRMRDAE